MTKGQTTRVKFGVEKRILDLLISLAAFMLLSPVMIFIAVLLRFSSGRGVFFFQYRPGFRGRPFKLCKFRTMNDRKDERGRLLEDSERLTPLGRWLRSTSLDELPELFNVLKGEMSIVGPRPLLMEYLDLYTPEQMSRHDVKPGITGWAQVNGRNAIPWGNRLKLDLWYVNHQSLRLDMQIIALTVYKVLRREGINYPGCPTGLKFTGTDRERVKQSLLR